MLFARSFPQERPPPRKRPSTPSDAASITRALQARQLPQRRPTARTPTFGRAATPAVRGAMRSAKSKLHFAPAPTRSSSARTRASRHAACGEQASRPIRAETPSGAASITLARPLGAPRWRRRTARIRATAAMPVRTRPASEASKHDRGWPHAVRGFAFVATLSKCRWEPRGAFSARSWPP